MSEHNKLCRTCLVSLESTQYCIYENVSPNIYYFCTSIQAKPEDTVSKAICNPCYNKLIEFYEFKNVCIQSYKTLLEYKENIFNKECEAQNDNEQKPIPKQEDICMESKVFEEIISNSKHSDDNSDVDNASVFADPLEKSNKILTCKRVNMKIDEEDTLNCDICNRRFVSLRSFKSHKLSHENKVAQRSLHCLPCNKKFLTRCGLTRHERTWHARVRLASVRCGACGVVARSRESLSAHLKLHAQRQRHICSMCGKVYLSSVGLKTHLETHQESRERECTCEYCGKKFYTKKNLNCHVARCHTGKRFICQICNYPFTDKHNLAKHMQIHDGKKLHKCKVCQKSFTTQFSYEEHQRIHSGERPFSCTFCPKSFLSKKRLIEHQRTHTGEKPHKCTVCSRGFSQRGTMKRHMKIHDKICVL